ncbi:hypothetical protein [Mucilaginibacter ginsenosidivorans]|uniref:Uncharacterized protein n=1 Tax=Mucilaginibacter ginsenosidivorans TaxID=398053 RepID=A0A5B8UWG9_9SPHI|nr:hypothetical protein [Mucilaginibacter ginsenosidivorans]QEC62786.1 hypothetical protein FRZ54_09395 [Mucilaginibacter ginsenosidivorans]
MRKLLLATAIFIIPFCSKAQQSFFKKSKAEIRATVKKSIPAVTTVSQSDTCDVYKLSSGIIESCYYKKNSCYKLKQVFSSPSNQVLQKSVQTMDAALTGIYRKTKDNTWIDTQNGAKIELSTMKAQNQFVIVYTRIQ